MSHLITNARLVLPDRVERGALLVRDGRIAHVGDVVPADHVTDLGGRYLLPGFVDLHVHGGDGADFMDGTPDAFRAVCRAHARHGTTSLLATSTVASHEHTLRFLRACREMTGTDTGGARVLGAHFYGPYFGEHARGCHPAAGLASPDEAAAREYLAYADVIRRATVAPELPGAEAFVRACVAAGVACNAGHSHATFSQVEAAVAWGVSHVDHLFCAMSDRARLRLTQTYPMRGGLMEATLLLDALTTEVIADGKHLSPELLRLALKCKGPDRLALVTDANRALGMPDGEYVFGPTDGGEPILRRDGVGLMPDGKSLASGVVGMDAAVRVMLRDTGAPLPDVVRMATLTPARIAGVAGEYGSLETGKRADLVVMNGAMNVTGVWVEGSFLPPLAPA